MEGGGGGGGHWSLHSWTHLALIELYAGNEAPQWLLLRSFSGHYSPHQASINISTNRTHLAVGQYGMAAPSYKPPSTTLTFLCTFYFFPTMFSGSAKEPRVCRLTKVMISFQSEFRINVDLHMFKCYQHSVKSCIIIQLIIISVVILSDPAPIPTSCIRIKISSNAILCIEYFPSQAEL